MDNLDCKSPDYHEHFSTKSVDESKASVYFTPTDGYLSPQPHQMSPIHINYINDGASCSGDYDEARGLWRSVPLRGASRSNHSNRASFQLPIDYLDEEDESPGNFIIPEPNYTDEPNDRFLDVVESPVASTSLMSLPLMSSHNSRRRKKRNCDQNSQNRCSVENETLLMHAIAVPPHDPYDVSKGARPKVYEFHHYDGPKRDLIGTKTKNCLQKLYANEPFYSLEDVPNDGSCSRTTTNGIKMVNSQVDIDGKTGKVVASPTIIDSDVAANINSNDEVTPQKFIKLQLSTSLPEIASCDDTKSSSSSVTFSSNSNNQSQTLSQRGGGKHVILAVEIPHDPTLNQIDGVGCDHQLMKKKIKLNINANSNSNSSNGSSSSNLNEHQININAVASSASTL